MRRASRQPIRNRHEQKTNNQLHLLTTTLLLITILVSCRSSTTGTDRDTTLKKLAHEAVGRENTIEFNSSETFALCQEQAGGSHARKQYRFVVIRLKDMAIVYKGTFAMGYVKWLDNDSIEVFSGSPSLKEEGSSKKIIPVNSPVE